MQLEGLPVVVLPPVAVAPLFLSAGPLDLRSGLSHALASLLVAGERAGLAIRSGPADRRLDLHLLLHGCVVAVSLSVKLGSPLQIELDTERFDSTLAAS